MTLIIALIEKQLGHDIEVQNPWQSDIAANPLSKVPALLLDDGRVVHDDAVLLIVTERARPKERQSADWIARQARRIPAALDELERLLAGKPFFTPHGFGLDALARALEPRPRLP